MRVRGAVIRSLCVLPEEIHRLWESVVPGNRGGYRTRPSGKASDSNVTATRRLTTKWDRPSRGGVRFAGTTSWRFTKRGGSYGCTAGLAV